MSKPADYDHRSDCAPTLAQLDDAKFSYLDKGQVPDGYAATPVPGVFVLAGKPVPPMAVLIGSIVPVVDWDPMQDLWTGDATLFTGDLLEVDGVKWYQMSSLSSFPYYGYMKEDGSESSEDPENPNWLLDLNEG